MAGNSGGGVFDTPSTATFGNASSAGSADVGVEQRVVMAAPAPPMSSPEVADVGVGATVEVHTTTPAALRAGGEFVAPAVVSSPPSYTIPITNGVGGSASGSVSMLPVAGLQAQAPPCTRAPPSGATPYAPSPRSPRSSSVRGAGRADGGRSPARSGLPAATPTLAITTATGLVNASSQPAASGIHGGNRTVFWG